MIVFLTIFAGANVVITRFLNSGSAKKNGLSMSTLMNYITGLVTVYIVLWILGEPGGFSIKGINLPTLFIYLGGTVGVVTILLSSYLAPRLPAFLMTLIIFIAQLLTALAIDYALTGQLSLGKLLGGLLVMLGLWHYQRVNNRNEPLPDGSQAAKTMDKEE